MLIDWITAKVDESLLTPEILARLRKMGDRIVRISCETGEQVYETQAWDSIRSDSHSVTVRLGSDSFWMQGSPARVMGDGCAVFGFGAAQKLDIGGCIEAMRLFVCKETGTILPVPMAWKVTRIDVTDNLMLKSESDVFEALKILSGTDDCGRYKVTNKAGNSVYWNSNSRRFKGKAYAKGQHLAYLNKLKSYDGKRYSIEEIERAKKLLRLELTIASQHLRENVKHWSFLDSEDLVSLHKKYFGQMIGDTKMNNVNTLREKLSEVCPTQRQADAAFDFLSFIKANGILMAKSRFKHNTFYRHKRYLKLAGLGDSDISHGQVVALRRRVLEMQSVHSWSDIKAA